MTRKGWVGNALGVWVEWVYRHAWLVVVAGILAAVLALFYTARNLGVNTDTGDMFPQTLPWRSGYLDYKQAFPVFTDTLLVVVDAPTPDLADQSAAQIAARIESDSELAHWVYRPGAGRHFERNGLLYLSVEELEQVTNELALMQPFLAKLERDASLEALFDITALAVEAAADGQRVDIARLMDQLSNAIGAALSGQFYSVSWQGLMLDSAARPGQSRHVVIVKPRVDFKELFPARRAIERIRAIAIETGLDKSRGIRVRITGDLALSHEELKSVSQGMARTGVLALMGVGIVLFLGLRSLRLVGVCLVTLLAGLCYTSAFAAFAVGHLNLISVAFAVLYIGLGLDYAIHFCLRYQELLRSGISQVDSLRQTASDVGASLAVCALTTGAGFFAFVPTDFVGVSELGVISGTGIFISLFSNLTILPALLALTRLKSGAPIRLSRFSVPDTVALRLARWRRGILCVAAVLAVGCLVSLSGVRFDRNPLNVRALDAESVVTLKELAADSGTSLWSLVALAEDSAQAAELAARLEALDTVEATRSLNDYIPKDQDEKLNLVEELALVLGFDPAPPSSEPSPSTTELITASESLRLALGRFSAVAPGDSQVGSARRLADALQSLETQLVTAQAQQTLDRLNRSVLETLPAQLRRLRASMQADRVTLDTFPADLTRRWVSADGQFRVEVTPKEDLDDPAALARFVSDVRSIAPGATDSAVLNLESGNTVARAFRQAMIVAFVVVLLVLWSMFRRLRDPLVVLAPLLLALGLTTATMVVIGLPFNYANIITLPLLLGIGVDSGIHMVHRSHVTKVDNVQLLRTSTTRAVVTSTLTMTCSFGNLAFSPHRGTASMGIVLTMGMLYVLVCTLVLVPALLATFAGTSKMPRGTRP